MTLLRFAPLCPWPHRSRPFGSRRAQGDKVCCCSSRSCAFSVGGKYPKYPRRRAPTPQHDVRENGPCLLSGLCSIAGTAAWLGITVAPLSVAASIAWRHSPSFETSPHCPRSKRLFHRPTRSRELATCGEAFLISRRRNVSYRRWAVERL